MNLDKIPEDRLFQNNTKEEVIRWARNLEFFHYMRDRGGHNCEGDSFCVYLKYNDRNDLIAKLSTIGIEPKPLAEGFIAFDPFESYSFDDLDKLKITIAQFPDLEQPQHVEILGYKVHVWVLNNRFEISVSGTRDGQVYKVSEDDFQVCLHLEEQFRKLGWKSILDEEIKSHSHCVSKEIYPELF
ncbi:hypothetical protein GGR21_000382 [Dysgonomonas hofstadii]|uniref:Uncharacterized protein n=1 Tax=Dysgonomonas hofstadii TaxID=637886 RepID=A0A840CET0_9BACT|nr:hypothetical protein [Dysgonomonas hofstadii]MBB4034497.1 hypothetical protein [Dysgonomonas hofstadii]